MSTQKRKSPAATGLNRNNTNAIHYNTSHTELELADALQAVFGRLNFVPIGDGQIQRFHAPGDRDCSKVGPRDVDSDSLVIEAWTRSKLGQDQ